MACMSGGGIGQICNLILLDPQVHEQVFTNTENNKLKTECPKEFVFKVDCASKRLEKLAASTPIRVVLPPILEAVLEIAG